MSDFTHFDPEGKAVMVDVSDKDETARVATARGAVYMSPETVDLIRERGFEKGDVLSVARLAGIMGAKRTPELIPLCHPLQLSSVKVDLRLADDGNAVEIEATCKITGQTGVEMEALTAADQELTRPLDDFGRRGPGPDPFRFPADAGRDGQP